MERLILRSSLPPGDILLLTAAVRDLHRCYPGRFLTDVRTGYGELWENNPHITKLTDPRNPAQTLDCESYSWHKKANQTPCHGLQEFVYFLNQRLGLEIGLTEFRADVHLSDAEAEGLSPVAELHGHDRPYWIIVSGGKRDFTIKWWDRKRYQQVVDHFQGIIQFVQVGAVGDFHPELEGVLDLRGKTTLRQLIRLVYHCSGVVCPSTFLMHLAAAVPTQEPSRLRPCVVIAGGREPSHWQAYPGHQLLQTIGMLPCCQHGGCFRVRTKPLRDKSRFNHPDHLCTSVVDDLPRCMDMIQAADVIRAIERFREGARLFKAPVDPASG